MFIQYALTGCFPVEVFSSQVPRLTNYHEVHVFHDIHFCLQTHGNKNPQREQGALHVNGEKNETNNKTLAKKQHIGQRRFKHNHISLQNHKCIVTVEPLTPHHKEQQQKQPLIVGLIRLTNLSPTSLVSIWSHAGRSSLGLLLRSMASRPQHAANVSAAPESWRSNQIGKWKNNGFNKWKHHLIFG